MTQHNTNTIVLDKNTRIELAVMGGRHDRAADIDPFLEPIEEFWMSLQTECTAKCCGVQAFGFQPKQIAKVSKQSGKVVFDQLMELHAFVLTHDSDTFVSNMLNQYFDRAQLIQLLEHLVDHLSPNSFVASDEQMPKSGARRVFAIGNGVVGFVGAAVMMFWPQWYLYVLIGIIVWVVFGFWMLMRN